MAAEDPSSVSDPATVRAQVEAVLENQRRAWLRGDLDALVATYWLPDDVRYATGAEVVRGIDDIRARFAAAYPDAAEMGHLEFSGIETTVLGPTDVLAFGRWEITRDAGPLRGLFSLHFTKTAAQGWCVRSDHTSSNV